MEGNHRQDRQRSADEVNDGVYSVIGVDEAGVDEEEHSDR